MGKKRQWKNRLAHLQGNLCAYCFKPFRYTETSSKGPLWMRRRFMPTIDHVIPLILGGTSRGNTVVVHSQCNHAKGGRAPTGCELIALEWVRALDTAALAKPVDMG